MKNVKQYYKELGKVVCLLVKADGKIQDEEILALRTFVLKEMAMEEKESDSSGMNKAFYVDFEFEAQTDQSVDREMVIAEFSSFAHRNAEPGDENLIARSILLLEKVSEAYQEDNEKVILEKVKSELGKISKIK